MSLNTTQAESLVAELAQQIAVAHTKQTPLRLVGAGTWLDAGRPVAQSATLSLAPLTGVIEYIPTDLVLTVHAGTTLAEIAAITAEHGQWLALDPMGDERGTIGATIATASSGPLALGSGTTRDLVLGLGLISGLGTRLRVGGRVVKNVAGFDLVRLTTGAFGTLGAITEVSVRLHAKPATDCSYAIAHDDAAPLLALVRSLGHNALAFHALELLDPSLAFAVGAGDGRRWVLLARATGNAAGAASLRQRLQQSGSVQDVSTDVWSALRHADGAHAVVRLSGAIASLDGTLSHAQSALVQCGISDAQLRVTPHRGTVRVIVPTNQLDDPSREREIATLVSARRSSAYRVIGERLPAVAWSALPSAADDPLARRLRSRFDPHQVLNRGILGETYV